MLGHLELYLKYNPVSPDAHFVAGLLLMNLMRYDEAHKEFTSSGRYASEDAQPEISAALKDLKSREDLQMAYEASKSAQPTTKASNHALQ